MAFLHRRSFLWAVVILASFSTRSDLAGVTSFVRSCFLTPSCYAGLLRAFHSRAIDARRLRKVWAEVALRLFKAFVVRSQERLVIIGDGLKNPKEGKRMPAVKLCHQDRRITRRPST